MKFLLRTLLCAATGLYWVAGYAQTTSYEEVIPQLSASLLEQTSSLGQFQLGITQFTDELGKPTELGKFLAEETTNALLEGNPSVKIIDQNRISFLLEKEKLKTTDLGNPSVADRISRKAMVDYLLLGQVSYFVQHLRLNVKIINLKTGEVVATARGKIDETATIAQLRDKDKVKTTPTPPPTGEIFTERSVKTEPMLDVPENTALLTRDASILPFKMEINRLEFVLKKCKRSGTNVSIFFTITNKAGDIDFKIDDKDTKIFAPVLEQLAAYTFRFDEQINPFMVKTLTTGVPVEAQFIFKNVPLEVKKIDQLSVMYYAGKYENFEITNIFIE